MEQIINGIRSKKRTYSGPFEVVIDVTNQCNCNCEVCWIYSPFIHNIDKQRLASQHIDFYRLLDVIDELAEMNVQSIRFSGGGEPLLYDGIVEAVEAVKQHGMKCAVTTNFTTVTREIIDRFIFWDVDELAVSVWAATAETYSATHPNRSEQNFVWITDMLKYLTEHKTSSMPFLTVSHVIYSENVHELMDMYRYSCDVGANAVYFTVADIVENATEQFALTEKQCAEAIETFREIIACAESDGIKIEDHQGFLARLGSAADSTGMYDKHRIDEIPCYAGWTFSRILAGGDVVPCCRGVKKIMGNIHTRSFSEIWNSEAYQTFRTMALTKKKTHAYFSEIGCYKSCDNFMHNQHMHTTINGEK